MKTATIDYGDLKWTVEYDYSPPVRGRQYLPNGDPGYPDEPEEIDLCGVYLANSGTDLLEFLSDTTLERLKEKISYVEESYRDEGAEL